MPLIALPVLIVVLIAILIPLSLVGRFRRGTARRQARPWLVSLNLVGVLFSIVMVLLGSLITRVWVPEAPTYTLLGLAAGGVLGLVGLTLTRWDTSGLRLEYTPNRWLVLGITLLVTARVLYGFWRMREAWDAAAETMTMAAASGAATSMSAGALVLGYYAVYWAGVRGKLRRFTR